MQLAGTSHTKCCKNFKVKPLLPVILFSHVEVMFKRVLSRTWIWHSENR